MADARRSLRWWGIPSSNDNCDLKPVNSLDYLQEDFSFSSSMASSTSSSFLADMKQMHAEIMRGIQQLLMEEDFAPVENHFGEMNVTAALVKGVSDASDHRGEGVKVDNVEVPIVDDELESSKKREGQNPLTMVTADPIEEIGHSMFGFFNTSPDLVICARSLENSKTSYEKFPRCLKGDSIELPIENKINGAIMDGNQKTPDSSNFPAAWHLGEEESFPEASLELLPVPMIEDNISIKSLPVININAGSLEGGTSLDGANFQEDLQDINVDVQATDMFDFHTFSTKDSEIVVKYLLEDGSEVFRQILQSIWPSIYGHELIKAGLTLALFGGVRRNSMNQNKVPVIGDIHAIIIGDPGLGKSQLLQAATSAPACGIYVRGNATTNDGITVAMVKDPMGSMEDVENSFGELIYKMILSWDYKGSNTHESSRKNDSSDGDFTRFCKLISVNEDFYGFVSFAYLALGLRWSLWSVQFWKEVIQLHYNVTVIALESCSGQSLVNHNSCSRAMGPR